MRAWVEQVGVRLFVSGSDYSRGQMIGTRLAHYDVTHLASGGMGDICQATDSKLGRSVAFMFLLETFARDADRVARFEREARVLASQP